MHNHTGKLNTAVAVIHFSGESETYAFHISGPYEYPAVELARFMEIVDRRLADPDNGIDPFTLQLMACGLFEGASCEVTGYMEISLAEGEVLIDQADCGQLRTL